MVSSIIKHSLMATLLVTSSAGTVDNKVTTGASPCLNLCWRRGSQCWYWHYNGLGDTYTEAKCDGIFDSCANSCNSQGMKLAAGNLSDTEAQVPKTSEDAAKKMSSAVVMASKATAAVSPCLNLCWRRGSQCWYWHYNGLGDTYTEAKCDGIFDSCANSCSSQGMKLAAGNLSDTEAQVPKTSEDAAKKMSSAVVMASKATAAVSPCLNLCWRRGSQCWYWHYNGLGDTYTEAKCDGIFDSCANSCNSQGMKLAAGNLSGTEAQVPKTSEDAAKKSPDAVLLP